jgi:predicted dehydrogenase
VTQPANPTRRALLGGAVGLGLGYAAAARAQYGRVEQWAKPRLEFGVIGIDHSHIVGQCNALLRGGGALTKFHARDDALAAGFAEQFPWARRVSDEREILEDPNIALVASSIVPDERAPLGIRVMRAGKDYMADKPGMTTLEQLAEARRVQRETGRIYSSAYSERFDNHATEKASELVAAGAIGDVVQTVGLGPHRVGTGRPGWFWDKARFGGILCDIASHQIDQFLHFTGSTSAEITAAQIGNFHHKDHPGLDDFGDVMLRGDGGAGYCRVDWFTPDGLPAFGDGRLTIVGSEGYIELRKYVDIAGRPGGNHLFLVDQKATRYIDCKDVELPFGPRFVADVANRTETAMPQAHTFLAMELVLKAQQQAQSPAMRS